MTTTNQLSTLPITYYIALDHALGCWLEEWELDGTWLRTATETAIRTRHHDAVIEEHHKAHHDPVAHRDLPDIFTICLGPVVAYYSIEPTAIMVRGYGRDLPDDADIHADGGACFR